MSWPTPEEEAAELARYDREMARALGEHHAEENAERDRIVDAITPVTDYSDLDGDSWIELQEFRRAEQEQSAYYRRLER